MNECQPGKGGRGQLWLPTLAGFAPKVSVEHRVRLMSWYCWQASVCIFVAAQALVRAFVPERAFWAAMEILDSGPS